MSSCSSKTHNKNFSKREQHQQQQLRKTNQNLNNNASQDFSHTCCVECFAFGVGSCDASLSRVRQLLCASSLCEMRASFSIRFLFFNSFVNCFYLFIYCGFACACECSNQQRLLFVVHGLVVVVPQTNLIAQLQKCTDGNCECGKNYERDPATGDCEHPCAKCLAVRSYDKCSQYTVRGLSFWFFFLLWWLR